MKILIASTIVPFIKGGGTQIVDWLETALGAIGHEVEVFRIPFHSSYSQMPAQMLGLRLIDVPHDVDKVIAIRTPSYLLRHHNKTVWFIHHHRGAYDLWGTEYQDLPNSWEGLRYREMFMNADNLALREAKSVFANSRVVAKRLLDFNNITAKVLYPPILHPERFRLEGDDAGIVYVSRITPHKRQLLAVEALLHTKTPVKLVIAGPPDDPTYVAKIEDFVAKRGLSGRVKISAGWIAEEDKVSLLANCLAALYIPFDEDSYGYPSLEAYHSSKAVITTTDSGGSLELVENEVNGLVTSPDPESIGAAFDRLWRDRGLAKRLGEAGPQRIRELGVDWETVTTGLIG